MQRTINLTYIPPLVFSHVVTQHLKWESKTQRISTTNTACLSRNTEMILFDMQVCGFIHRVWNMGKLWGEYCLYEFKCIDSIFLHACRRLHSCMLVYGTILLPKNQHCNSNISCIPSAFWWLMIPTFLDWRYSTYRWYFVQYFHAVPDCYSL